MSQLDDVQPAALHALQLVHADLHSDSDCTGFTQYAPCESTSHSRAEFLLRHNPPLIKYDTPVGGENIPRIGVVVVVRVVPLMPGAPAHPLQPAQLHLKSIRSVLRGSAPLSSISPHPGQTSLWLHHSEHKFWSNLPSVHFPGMVVVLMVSSWRPIAMSTLLMRCPEYSNSISFANRSCCMTLGRYTLVRLTCSIEISSCKLCSPSA